MAASLVSVVSSHGATLLNEGFEGPGFENAGWTVPSQSTSAPNPDYSATPLVGSQSLRCNGVSFIQRPFVNSTEFYAYCQVRWLAWSDFRVVLDWLNSDNTSAATVYADFGRRLQVIHGGVANRGNTVINDNTTYHLWVEWTKGTGANGTMKLFLSTSGFKPATPEASVTTGQGGALAFFDIGPFGTGADVVYDNVIIADAPIGDNPSANAPPTISDIPNQSILPDTTLGPVPFTIGDAETPASALTLTTSSSNTGLVPNGNIALGGSGASRTISITPVSGQTGASTISVSVSDGTNTATDTFILNVSVANTPPTISDIANQTINQDTTLGPIAFTVGDAETAPGSLIVTASSSNPGLIPNGAITLGGSGASRTITATPLAGQSGSAIISVVVNDGQATASDTFLVTVNQSGGNGTFVLEEGFEGPGYENTGWNPSTGTPNPDYSIFPLQGQQSLFLASGSSINRAFPLSSQFALYCRVRFPDAFVQFTSLFQWWTFGFGSQVAGVTTEFGDRLQLTHGTANATAFIPTIVPNTTYHVWVEWTGNTGANDGTMRLYISEDATKPPGAQAVLNNGVGANPAILVVGPYAGGNGVIVDSILVSDSPIGSNPGGNGAPSISMIPNFSILPNTTLGPVNFTIGDPETPASALSVSASSSNPTLVPPSAITLGGSAETRTITIVPAAGELGVANITVNVTDGTNTATDTFSLTVSTSAGSGQFALDEGFEGPGYENTGWNAGTGTPNPDFTGLALDGSQSLFLGSGASINRAFSLNNEFNVYARVHWPDSFVQFTSVFQWWTAGFGAQVAGVATEFGDRLQLTHGTAAATAVIPTIVPNTTYHIWVEWSANSGAADGTMRLFISTTGDKPAAPQALLNNGIGANAQILVVGPYSGGNGLIIDSLLVSENPIGSNPGVNTPPTITSIPAQTIDQDTSTAAIPFTIGDAETSASALALDAASSNTALVPRANIVFGGSGANRTVTVTPLPGQTGSADITVFVSDGEATNSTTFNLVVNQSWLHQDVGAVGLAGDATFAAGNWTISGSGVDIWDYADGFHYAYRSWTGDGEIIARVTSLTNTDPWAKAGVMIRETLNTDAPHAFICVTPGSGAAFQRRLTAGNFSLHTPGPVVVAPYWVRLVRTGDKFQGYISPDGSAWTFVGEDTVPMGAAVFIGMAVTAHNNTLLSTGTFTDILTRVPAAPPQLAITAPATGSIVVPGSSTNITVDITANAAAVTKVQFYDNGALLGEDDSAPYSFTWNTITLGQHLLVARAVHGDGLVALSSPVSVNAINPLQSPWLHQDVGAVGLAGDATLDAGVFNLTGSGTDIWDYADGFHFVHQPWTGDGEIIARVNSVANTDPWAKAGVMFRQSLDTGSAHAFMAVTPGNGSAFQRRPAANTFSLHTPGAFIAAPYWVRLVRVGDQFTGYISADGVSWTLVGTDVVPMTTTLYVGLAVTAHNNALLTSANISDVTVRRPLPEVVLTSPTNGAVFTAPATVTVSADVAANGHGIATVQFFAGEKMIEEVFFPPYSITWSSVSAGSYALTAQVITFEELSVTSAPVKLTVNEPLPAPWQNQDVGAVGQLGSATHQSGAFTIAGGGADIWDLADGFHMVHQTWTGDVEIIARVASLTNTDPWAKAGVMIRETLAAGSRHAFMCVTPGNGSAFQRRIATDGVSTHTAGPAVTAPYWVRLVRIGSAVQGFISANGTTWTLVGSETLAMNASLSVGLAVTAHNNALLNTSVLDNVLVRRPLPSVAITAPVNGAVFVAPATINIAASVSSNGNAIASVQFYSNGVLVGEDAVPPYTLSRTGVAAGNYALAARAVFDNGRAVTSSVVSIVVVAPPSAPTGLTATAVATNRINLAWAAGSANHTGFVIERSLNGTTFTQIATVGPTTLAIANTGLSPNTLYYYRVRATNSVGSSGYSAIVSARTFLLPVKVNFQPLLSTVPTGYLLDYGATYASRGNGQTYGWNVSNTSTARDRNSTLSPDQRYDTLQHMQLAGTGSTWELALPSGTYSVFLVAGDASATDSVYRINIEGALAVSGTPTTATRWFSGTRTATVTDGRLTISNGTGAVNNKICFIEVTQVVPVTTSIAAGATELLVAASDTVTALRVELAGRDDSGRLTLRVPGVPADGLQIETSADMLKWVPITVIPDAEGNLTVETGELERTSGRYFRAIQIAR